MYTRQIDVPIAMMMHRCVEIVQKIVPISWILSALMVLVLRMHDAMEYLIVPLVKTSIGVSVHVIHIDAKRRLGWSF